MMTSAIQLIEVAVALLEMIGSNVMVEVVDVVVLDRY